MPDVITSAVAQPFQFAASYTFTVVDDASPSGRTVSFPADPTKVYRTFLAKQSGAAGTPVDPLEFLAGLTTALGADWFVSLQANGLVGISYFGTTHAGALRWYTTGAPLVAQQAGFLADVTIGVNGTMALGIAPPNHIVYMNARSIDSSWSPRQPQIAVGRMGDGTVYSFSSGQPGMQRKFESHAHPKDAATRTANGWLASPMFDAEQNWGSPNSGTGLVPLGWSMRQFLASAPGQCLGFTPGHFQDLVAGALSDFSIVYLSPAACQGAYRAKPTSPRWDALYDVLGLEFESHARGIR